MLFTYKQISSKYGSDYQLKKRLSEQSLFKVQDGVYSTERHSSDLELISLKYPNAVFTMDSAFYYHGLTDVIPDSYFLATPRSATRIHDERIRQCFLSKPLFPIGKSTLAYQNHSIPIYDLERMLIELVRNKNKLPFDYYKEIIASYRKKSHAIDFAKLESYAAHFWPGAKIIETIQMEVL